MELALPGYRDYAELASSSTSRVYRAWQEVPARPVAIKVLQLRDREWLERFQREIEITVRLGRQHPNIIKVIDVAMTGDGRPCIVMEFCELGSLRDRLHDYGPLPVNEVLEAGEVVADVLAFAHAQEVLHRDIKPQNILVLPTSYVVADFGIARPIDAAQHTSSVDWFTFQHASPQVVDGQAPAVADDLWSLGSTLYMLTEGRPPFDADSPADNNPLAYMARVRSMRPRPITRPDTPVGLRRVIERCLQYERQHRYPDATALREALREVGVARSFTAQSADDALWAPPGLATDSASRIRLPGEDVATAPPPKPTAPAELSTVGARPSRRRLLGLAAAGIVAGITVGSLMLWRDRPQGTQPHDRGTSVSASANVNNPAIAPAITSVQANDGTVVVRWRDAANGQATFIVVRVKDGEGKALVTVPAGSAETTLPGQGQDGPHCYLVIAVSDHGRGVSPAKCAGEG